MPAFRIPRAMVEIEVSRLEAQGYRVDKVVVDGDDLIVFVPPLWPARNPIEIERRPTLPDDSVRVVIEAPEWRAGVTA